MRRHLRWMVYLLLVPIGFYVVAAIGLSLMSSGSARYEQDHESGVGLLLGGVGLLVAAVAISVVFLVLALIEMSRTARRARRRKGRFTRAEQQIRALQDHERRAWVRAREMRQSLLRRQVPPVCEQWDVVLRPGEFVFARLQLGYARYYGRDVSYSQSGGFFFGRPGFVISAMAVTAIANANARSQAAAQAAPQWREWQTSVVYVTNQRLIVLVSGRWLTFDYSAMTAVYPEVSARTLICQFSGGVEPLMLTGSDAPIAAVVTVVQTFGIDALARHPSLHGLDFDAPVTALPPIGRERPSKR